MNMNDYPQISITDYIFEWNHIQGIINVEKANDEEFGTCIELGAGTKLDETEFRYKCEEWIEKWGRQRI